MPQYVFSPDGTTIAVWTSGDGPPLVMVHGAMADHSALAALVRAEPFVRNPLPSATHRR
jgi:pimeloyl-ACP methyl ester carboxylesterase